MFTATPNMYVYLPPYLMFSQVCLICVHSYHFQLIMSTNYVYLHYEGHIYSQKKCTIYWGIIVIYLCYQNVEMFVESSSSNSSLPNYSTIHTIQLLVSFANQTQSKTNNYFPRREFFRRRRKKRRGEKFILYSSNLTN